MTWGAVAGAAVGVVGAAISSSAAGDAADAQSQSAQQANATQLAMYNNNVALSAPAINTGNAARDRLSFLLGLSGTGYSGSTLPQAGGMGGGMFSTSSTQPLTYEQLRAQLAPQFTTAGTGPGGVPELTREQQAVNPLAFQRTPEQLQAMLMSPDSNAQNMAQPWMTQMQGGASTINEAGLDAAIRARLAQQEQEAAQREAAARADPAFGSLAQRFQFQHYTPQEFQAATFTPEKFSYTGQDLYNDPSYLFRLSQGQKALDRQGLAAGRFLSGGQLQASSNYNQNAASQEFQNAYARAQNTFNTNETGRYNAFNLNETGRYNAFNLNETNRANAFNTGQANDFNAYQANFQNTVNPLLALSGSGQLAGGQMMQANQQTANVLGANLMGAANAQGAAGIAGANAINQGLSSAVNGYQTNRLLQRFGGVNNNPSYGWNPSTQIDQLGAANNWWEQTNGN